MGVALLRQRSRELLRAAWQELLDASKAWWRGRRGRHVVLAQVRDQQLPAQERRMPITTSTVGHSGSVLSAVRIASRHSIVSSGFRIGSRASAKPLRRIHWISPIRTDTPASSAACGLISMPLTLTGATSGQMKRESLVKGATGPENLASLAVRFPAPGAVSASGVVRTDQGVRLDGEREAVGLRQCAPRPHDRHRQRVARAVGAGLEESGEAR